MYYSMVSKKDEVHPPESVALSDASLNRTLHWSCVTHPLLVAAKKESGTRSSSALGFELQVCTCTMVGRLGAGKPEPAYRLP